jgi:hypothetical protein
VENMGFSLFFTRPVFLSGLLGVSSDLQSPCLGEEGRSGSRGIKQSFYIFYESSHVLVLKEKLPESSYSGWY